MKILQYIPGQRLVVASPAKLNLVLEVLSKREDGYHEISSVMCPVELWDRLEFYPSASPELTLDLELPTNSPSDDPAWWIPSDSSNLVLRAAAMVRQTLGVSSGCQIRLQKSIPAAAGLGGGSGNAAAAVVACLLLWSRWNRGLAAELCQQLGSDLNFFLGSDQGFGLMHTTGRGEKTSLIPAKPVLSFWITHPSVGCSTAAVYSQVVSPKDFQKVSDFLKACETGQKSKIGAALFNALQLPASELNPWIGKQLQLLGECGCRYRQMTGSGSSCFGLTPENVFAEDLRRRARSLGIPRVFETFAWYGDSIEVQLERL